MSKLPTNKPRDHNKNYFDTNRQTHLKDGRSVKSRGRWGGAALADRSGGDLSADVSRSLKQDTTCDGHHTHSFIKPEDILNYRNKNASFSINNNLYNDNYLH